MNMLKLIATIAGQRIALPADAIESVVEIDAITPVPLAAAHVAGLAALRSRVLTVIDTYAALELGQYRPADQLQAVVVTIDGHLYGLLVDEVEDVVAIEQEPEPQPAGLASGWAVNTIGLVEHEGSAILLLDPARLVTGPAALAAAA
jgi:purine-binding chemotaxis protein CheW